MSAAGSQFQRKLMQLSEDRTIDAASFADTFFGDEGCRALAEILAAPGSSITSLDLRGCNIRNDGASALSQMLRSNTILRILDLEWNSVGALDNGIAVLSDALLGHPSLTSLDLRNNSISPNGGCYLARAIQSNSVLTKLDVRWNNIGVSGGKALAQSMEHNRSIRELLLSGNKAADVSVLNTVASNHRCHVEILDTCSAHLYATDD